MDLVDRSTRADGLPEAFPVEALGHDGDGVMTFIAADGTLVHLHLATVCDDGIERLFRGSAHWAGLPEFSGMRVDPLLETLVEACERQAVLTADYIDWSRAGSRGLDSAMALHAFVETARPELFGPLGQAA